MNDKFAAAKVIFGSEFVDSLIKSQGQPGEDWLSNAIKFHTPQIDKPLEDFFFQTEDKKSIQSRVAPSFFGESNFKAANKQNSPDVASKMFGVTKSHKTVNKSLISQIFGN